MVFKIRTLSLPEPCTQEDLLVIHGSPLKRFSWRELKEATDNFSDKNFLGRGGFSKVYRATLRDGSAVAVKRLKKGPNRGCELQFQAEVAIGGSQASGHRNVVRLCGYCLTRKERLLVYPFMVNKSLATRLRDCPESEQPLDWATRKRIALGAAKGLAHLHSASSFKVLHRDLKADNILLDDQFEALLSDFGLAKFVGRNSDEELSLSNSGWVQRPVEEDNEDPYEEESEDDDKDKYGFTVSCWNFTKTLKIKSNEAEAEANYDFTQVTTGVGGTMGHIAPKYLSTGKCSVRSDVFGYGIVFLEIITGQKAFDLARHPVMLHDWVQGLLQENKMEMVIDSGMREDCVEEEVEQLLELALLCTKRCPMDRPVMQEVVKMIENIGKRPSHCLVQRFSPTQEVEAVADATAGGDTMDRTGCVWVASDNSKVLEQAAVEAVPIKNTATNLGFIYNFKIDIVYVVSLLFLIASISLNFLCTWILAKRWDSHLVRSGVVLTLESTPHQQ